MIILSIATGFKSRTSDFQSTIFGAINKVANDMSKFKLNFKFKPEPESGPMPVYKNIHIKI